MKAPGYLVYPILTVVGALIASAVAAQHGSLGRVIEESANLQLASCYPPFGDRIFFDPDSAELRPDAMETMKQIVEYLLVHPVDELTIEGHTASWNSDEYSFALGMRRAEAARDALIALGLPAETLRIVSYGKRRPAVPGDDAAAMAQNRHVQFVVGHFLEEPRETPCGNN